MRSCHNARARASCAGAPCKRRAAPSVDRDSCTADSLRTAHCLLPQDSRVTNATHAWVPRGKQSKTRSLFWRGQRYTTIAAISHKGVVACMTLPGSATGDIFQGFIANQVVSVACKLAHACSYTRAARCRIHVGATALVHGVKPAATRLMFGTCATPRVEVHGPAHTRTHAPARTHAHTHAQPAATPSRCDACAACACAGPFPLRHCRH